MFLTFRSEFRAALLAVFLLAGSVAPAAAAKRISIPLGAPPDVAADSAASIARRSLELPLWVGVEIGGGASHESWGGLDDKGVAGRLSMALLTPTFARNWRRRFSASLDLTNASQTYRRVDFSYDGQLAVYGQAKKTASRTIFTADLGWERVCGEESRPWGSLGAGLALGVGEESRSNVPDPEWTSLLQFVTRTGVYLYSSPEMRYGFSARGAVGFPFTGHYGDDSNYSLAVLFSVERSLSLPARFAPARD